jgi:hypothetical protein
LLEVVILGFFVPSSFGGAFALPRQEERAMSNRFTMSGVMIAAIASSTFVLAGLSSEPGRLVVWGMNTDPLVMEGAPSGEFVSLAAGGNGQTLAIRADGTLSLNPAGGLVPTIPDVFADSTFCAVGLGRNHGLAIRPDGSIVAWPPDAAIEVPTGQFVAVTGARPYHSVALDAGGNIVVWPDDPQPPPVGRFKAIAARGRHTLALSDDGNIYGWGTDASGTAPFGVFAPTASDPWTSDGSGHFIAPMEPGNPYTAIAAGLGLIVALRADGSVAQWALSPDMPAAPAGVVFTQVAAGSTFAVGMDQSGQLHVWGHPVSPWFSNFPAGTYSAVSAALTHVTAIEAPKQSLWPPNHKMRTVVLTFRADHNCTPVPLSGLSVELRSNQPDDGFDSGHTTGDTNGNDGYTEAVVLPATAIDQNDDGSFTATFQVRAERSDALSGPRTYTVAIVSSDGATPPDTHSRVTAQIVVEPDGD